MLIEADELLTKLDDPNIRIYDATILFFRSESDPTAYERYLEAHVPGAAFFDHQNFSDPNSDYELMVAPEAELAAQIGRIGIDEDSEVVFYTSGYLPCATRAWWLLHYAGHNNVRILNGGLAA
jgi:thiosulfate/3-mercaptopyruvate sulfurtransferase